MRWYCEFFTMLSVWVDDFSLPVICTPRNLTLHLLHYCPIDVDRGVLPLLFPEVHDHLLCFVDVECEVIFLTPHTEGPHLLSVGRLPVGSIPNTSSKLCTPLYIHTIYTVYMNKSQRSN